jgi:branched-chain amino acid transport system ATP-binding protein
MNVITIDNISKSYGPVRAVQDISFNVRNGEIFGLIGPDGAGKTSLFRVLTSLLLPDSGKATVAGLDVVKDYKQLRQVIGYMPGRFSLYQDLTVEENLTSVARTGPWDVKRVYELFPRLEERKRNLGTALSGGEQQMLAFGRALVLNPRLLLLDEPLEGLAPIIVAELLRAIRQVARDEGLPSIVVEQHPHMVLGVTDDAIVLDRGGIAYRATSQALRDDPTPLDAWLGVAATLPEARGRGAQKALILARLALAAAEGCRRAHSETAVLPGRNPSLANLTACGFSLVHHRRTWTVAP